MALFDSLHDTFARIRQWIEEEVNFFRLHLLFFTLTPLVAAGIFYGVNGEFHIPFIDALFLCYSALTVTGLSTVNLSTLTVFQQAILLVLMAIGNVTIVAWVMVLIRMHYFRQHIVARHRKKTLLQSIRDRVGSVITGGGSSTPQKHVEDGTEKHKVHGSHGIQASDGIGAALAGGATTGLGLGIALGAGDVHRHEDDQTNGHWRNSTSHIDISVDTPGRLSPSDDFTMHPDEDQSAEHGVIADVHSFTSSPRSGAMALPQSPLSPPPQHLLFAVDTARSNGMVRRRPGVPVPRRRTIIAPKMEYTDSNRNILGQRDKDQGLGGFPGPLQLARRLARRYFPDAYERLLVLGRADDPSRKHRLKWLSDSLKGLVVGRNSEFNTEELSDEQLEELGGIEYRALRMLSYIVILYFIGTQLVSFTLIAPWLSTTHTYDDVFASQPRLVNKSWFTIFQVVGAYTGGGMSLVDAGMVPFQRAYLMIFAMIFAILAGNHGLPIFLRLIIWVYTKLVKDDGPTDQVLHFLLDHPRRCFLYLFPSHVSWYLTATLIFFTMIEWVCFIVLDIGLEVTDSLPGGTRAVAGLFQSFAVRASGFPIVSLSALAPSFQFLCIIMMYIAVYPVALSIRSTNVYEEKSLGVFEAPPEDEDEEPDLTEKVPRRERIGKYFGWHLRRQVAFDIWWLVWAIFLICIIERTKIMDDANAPWFNLFRIVFELVSAFGGIGLTLGIPTENFSFSGAFGPLSKLVVIVIMVRGRHRGLPVAIDRAILLPEDLVPAKSQSQSQSLPSGQPAAPGGQVTLVANNDLFGKEKTYRN
ncbi:TrkH-domain-containing protein [Polyporus arcularius HHB13444]|uniref:TrkH-domain-containing protein n=1 Tax=Polyporus arcularius HHB13444 TaxID=1314778 RepID=A0A5C3PHI8_9APHY|nr:TrkH-domain-containing protein [Polyporus arcularius HHB13444]